MFIPAKDWHCCCFGLLFGLITFLMSLWNLFFVCDAGWHAPFSCLWQGSEALVCSEGYRSGRQSNSLSLSLSLSHTHTHTHTLAHSHSLFMRAWYSLPPGRPVLACFPLPSYWDWTRSCESCVCVHACVHACVIIVFVIECGLSLPEETAFRRVYCTVIHFYFGSVQFSVKWKFAVSVRRKFR